MVSVVGGRLAEAESLIARAVAIREEAIAPDHPDLASALEVYAIVLQMTGRESEGEAMDARAAAIRGN